MDSPFIEEGFRLYNITLRPIGAKNQCEMWKNGENHSSLRASRTKSRATASNGNKIVQLLIMTTVWLRGISCGVVLAYPAVLQERMSSNSSNFSDFTLSPEQSSWLAACVGIPGVFGFILLSALLDLVGRKYVFITVFLIELVSWVVLYFATSFTWLFIGRCFHGLSLGITYISGLVISEYSGPEHRGYYITLLKVFMSLGSLLCHCLSFWTWREPALAGLAIVVLGLILNMFWPESPSYSAKKERFEECKKAFIWLNGSSKEKRRELAELISAQIERNKSEKNIFLLFSEAVRDKGFQRAMLLSSLLTFVVDCSGRFFVIAYITQIMMELVGSGSAVYYSIFVDCLAITAFLLSCFTLKFMKRRTILFYFGSVTGSLMLFITVASFLTSDMIWLTSLLIIMQNFVNNLTLIPVCYTLFGEIFPLNYRGLGSCLSGIVFSIFYGINLKITPIMMKGLGLGGTYGAYGGCVLLALLILYFLVPETKNKTLQQIEDSMKGVRRNPDEFLSILNEKNATPAAV